LKEMIEENAEEKEVGPEEEAGWCVHSIWNLI
jgi:hypothetical protein